MIRNAPSDGSILCERRDRFYPAPLPAPTGLTLRFRFGRGIGGCLCAGGMRAKISDGAAALDFSALPDGVYAVNLVREGKTEPVGRYEKKDGRMRDAAWDSDRLFAQAEEVRRLSGQIDELKSRLDSVEKKVGTDVLLKL